MTPDDGGGAEAELKSAEEQVTHFGGKAAPGGRLLGRSMARTPSKPRSDELMRLAEGL